MFDKWRIVIVVFIAGRRTRQDLFKHLALFFDVFRGLFVEHDRHWVLDILVIAKEHCHNARELTDTVVSGAPRIGADYDDDSHIPGLLKCFFHANDIRELHFNACSILEAGSICEDNVLRSHIFLGFSNYHVSCNWLASWVAVHLSDHGVVDLFDYVDSLQSFG